MNLKELSTSNLIKSKDIPINLSKEMLNSAESGFKEFNTAKKVLAVFKDLGLKNIKNNIALTGIVGTLDTGIDGPNIAILGELDALPVPGHPFENKENGMAHACGHHIQIGNIVSVIIALKDPKILEKLTGKITFIAVPAEEFVEIEWRNELRKKNIVEFLSGKQEMLKLGVFGGCYFEGKTKEYPKEWFIKAKISKTFDIQKNYFRVKAGLSRKHWVEKGWIFKQDPLGWFQ